MGTTNQYQNKDAELFAAIRRLQQGDNADVNRVYELSQRYIYKIINDIVKNHETTEDLMQETYMQVYNKLNTLQVPETFYVWAGRIATNATLRYIQKNRHEVLATADENGSTDFVFECARDDSQDAFIPESILTNREAQRLLAEIIDGLSIEQKLSVQYFYYEEMSVSEIAQAMNCSMGTVKSRLNYARKSIKDAVIDLDKNQGTRLYSMAALPVFMLVFQAGVDGLLAGGAAAAGAAVVAQGIGAGAGSVANAAGVASVGNAAVAGNVAVSGVASGTAGTAAGAVASVAGKSFMAKVLGTTIGKVIVAGVTTVVVAGGAIGVTEIVKNVTADKPAQGVEADADDDRHGNGGSGENADIPDSFTEEEWEAWEEGEKVSGNLFIQFGMYKEGDGELGEDMEACLVGFTTDYQDFSKFEDYGYAISEELLEDEVQNVVDSLEDLPGYDFLSSLMLQLYKEHGEEYEMSYYETEELAYGENEITKEELLKMLKWDKKAPDFLKLGDRHYEILGLTDFAVELDGAENMMMLVLTVNYIEEENAEEGPVGPEDVVPEPEEEPEVAEDEVLTNIMEEARGYLDTKDSESLMTLMNSKEFENLLSQAEEDENGVKKLVYIPTGGTTGVGIEYISNYDIEWSGFDTDYITDVLQLQDENWQGGWYIGDFTNGKREGNGTFIYIYEQDGQHGREYTEKCYSGMWTNDLPNGGGTWASTYYREDMGEYSVTGEIQASNGMFSGSFAITKTNFADPEMEVAGSTGNSSYTMSGGMFNGIDPQPYFANAIAPWEVSHDANDRLICVFNANDEWMQCYIAEFDDAGNYEGVIDAHVKMK